MPQHSALDITEDKVKMKLEKLKPNSAPGPDKLWPRVLQNLSAVIALPLSIVYTRCLAEGTVPPDWKLANVTPIFKKGSKGSPGNYRPVSLTCVLCKVMESILRDGIVQHLEKYDLLLGALSMGLWLENQLSATCLSILRS